MPDNYERVTPRERRGFGFAEVWVNSDHLLHIRSSRFAEDYQRFRWKDIQTISVTELPHGTGAQWAAILISGLLMLAGWLIPNAWGWRIFWGIWGTIAFPIALSNLLRGPKCRCYIHTAAGTELLSGVARVRRAEVFLRTVRERIRAVQGELGAVQGWDQPPQIAPAEPSSPFGEADTQGVNTKRRLAYFLFALWIGDAILSLVAAFLDKTGQTMGLGVTASVVETILVIYVIRQFHTLDDLGVRRIAIAGLIFQLVDWGMTGYFVTEMFREGLAAARAREYLSLPYAVPGLIFTVGWRVMGAAAGFWSLRRKQPKEESIPG